MSAASARPFFLGTCRMQDPAAALMARGWRAAIPPLRTHSPLQTAQLARHLAGEEGVYRRETLHLVSDYSIAELAMGQQREHWRQLLGLRDAWRAATVLVVEISTLREQIVLLASGADFAASTFHARDAALYADLLAARARRGRLDPASPPMLRRLTHGEALAAMRQVKAAAPGRPVIWVSHVRPPDGAPGLETLIAVRRHLAETLASAAASLGDRFFDPSAVAAEMGATRFFADEGADFDHLTIKGAEALAACYAALIEEAGEAKRDA